jgi:hypothetical protein
MLGGTWGGTTLGTSRVEAGKYLRLTALLVGPLGRLIRSLAAPPADRPTRIISVVGCDRGNRDAAALVRPSVEDR